MDPISTTQSRLTTLEQMSHELGERLSGLMQERLGVEGGITALTQLMQEIEAHKKRLADEKNKQPSARQAELEHVFSGINDALTYVRVSRKSAQSNAYMLWGRSQEAQRTREVLAAQGKEEAARLSEMLSELERGVDREMVGRPRSVAEVTDDIARRKLQAEEESIAAEPVKKRRRKRNTETTEAD